MSNAGCETNELIHNYGGNQCVWQFSNEWIIWFRNSNQETRLGKDEVIWMNV